MMRRDRFWWGLTESTKVVECPSWSARHVLVLISTRGEDGEGRVDGGGIDDAEAAAMVRVGASPERRCGLMRHCGQMGSLVRGGEREQGRQRKKKVEAWV